VTDETALLNRAAKFDEDALAELYDRYAPQMYTYIYRRLGDAALAEDLTGELFVRVLGAIQHGNIWRDSFMAWMYRIAHNLVVDHYRRRPPLSPVELDDALLSTDGHDPLYAVQEGEAQEQLRAALSHLTAEQQEVLALRFGEGWTARKTAQVMNKTTGAVEALQRRALTTLRRLLNKEGSI
jgi:RNA polymerase sigma-70 factor (ECF subfamily)